MSILRSALLLLLWSVPAIAGDVVVDGTVESTGVGFKFPDGSVQSTAANEPRIPIDSVPFVIDESGSYFLASNLSHSGAGDAITIDAPSVTLDLMGFTLDGTGSSGNGVLLRTTGAATRAIEIRNGTIRNFGGTGITATPGNRFGARIAGVQVVSNGARGISLSGAPRTSTFVIVDCVAKTNGGHGIFVEEGIIARSVAHENFAAGIVGERTQIIESRAVENSTHGLSVGGGGLIVRSSAYRNETGGIELRGEGAAAIDNTVADNHLAVDVTTSAIRAQ